MFASATPLLLSYQSVGFSSNEKKEVFKFDIQISGTQKSVYWIYDHSLNSFETQSVNSKLSQLIGLSADDISLSNVVISGRATIEDIIVSYAVDGNSRVYLSQIKSDGTFVADIIEQITGEVLQNEIVNLRSERDLIFIDTAGELLQITNGTTLSPSDLVLDDNQSRDVYLIDTSTSSIKYLSQLEGRSLQGHTELVETYSSSNDLRVLLKTKASISSKDNNESHDFILLDFVSDLELDSLNFLTNSDGTFFNQGVSEARFYSNDQILIETTSTNIDDLTFDPEINLLEYSQQSETLSVFRFSGVNVENSLNSIRLLDAAANGHIAIVAGTDVNSQKGDQVYLIDRVSVTENRAQLASTINAIELSKNDGILSGIISDYGTVASLKLYSPNWVLGESLSDEGSFFINNSFLNRGVELTLGGKVLNHGTIHAELDSNVFQVSSETGHFDLQGNSIGTITLDSSMHTSDINIGDVISSLRHIVGLDTLTGKAALAADVDNNTRIDIGDVISQLRHIVGLDEINTFDVVNAEGVEVGNTLANQTSVELILNGDVDLSTILQPSFYDV